MAKLEEGGGEEWQETPAEAEGEKKVTIIKLAFEISKTKSFTKELRMMKMMVIMMMKKPSIITEKKRLKKEEREREKKREL